MSVPYSIARLLSMELAALEVEHSLWWRPDGMRARFYLPNLGFIETDPFGSFRVCLEYSPSTSDLEPRILEALKNAKALAHSPTFTSRYLLPAPKRTFFPKPKRGCLRHPE